MTWGGILQEKLPTPSEKPFWIWTEDEQPNNVIRKRFAWIFGQSWKKTQGILRLLKCPQKCVIFDKGKQQKDAPIYSITHYRQTYK